MAGQQNDTTYEIIQQTLADMKHTRLRDVEQLTHARIDLRDLAAHCFHPLTFLPGKLTAPQKRIRYSLYAGQRVSDLVS
jgi:hypothetical protein